MAISIKSNATADSYILQGLLLESNVHDVWNMNMSALASAIISDSLPPSTIEKLEAVGIQYSNNPVASNKGNLTTFAVDLKTVLDGLQHGGNFSSAMYVTGMVMACVTSVIVVLRIFSRIKLANGVRLEDWFVIFALFMSLVFSSLMQHSTRYGGGTHIYDCTYADIYWIAKCLFFCQFIYVLGIMAVKASLLIFYYRLSLKKCYRRAVVGVGIFIGLMSLGLLIAMVFQCKPIAYWNGFFEKKCFNMLAYWRAFGALSMISDVMIWVLPIPIVWKLGLKTREKIVVIGLFSLGLLVCVASLVRLLSLSSFITNVDFTSREGVTGLWSLVELDVAIICASIPALKGLFTAFSFRVPFTTLTIQTSRGRNSPVNKTNPTNSTFLTADTATVETHQNVSSSEASDAAVFVERKDAEASVFYYNSGDDIEAAQVEGEYRASVDSGLDFFPPPSFPGQTSRLNRRSLGPHDTGSGSASGSTLDNMSDSEFGTSLPEGMMVGLRPRDTPARLESRREVVEEENNTIGPMYSHGVPLKAGLRKPSAFAGIRKGSMESRKGSLSTVRKDSMSMAPNR